MFCGCGQHLQSPAQCCQWWERKEMGPCSFATANCFPWNLAPNMCSNSSGRGLILAFPAVREEPRTPHLSARGACVQPCQCCSWQMCTSAQGRGAARQRAGALAAVCGVGRCFTHCDTPPLEAEGSLSDILRDTFQTVPSLLLAQHRKQ